MKRKFPKDLLKSWGIPHGYGHAPHEATILLDEEVDSGRWHQYHQVVFIAPDDGKTWRVGYSSGLTEIQEMQPWDDEDNHVDLDGTVEGVEVEPFEITTIGYRPVKEKP